jgi:hypothetical protein
VNAVVNITVNYSRNTMQYVPIGKIIKSSQSSVLLLWYRITKFSSVLYMQRDTSKLHVCFLIV